MRFTSLFGMGRGGATSLRSPENFSFQSSIIDPPDFTFRLSSFELRLKEQSLAGFGRHLAPSKVKRI